MKPPEQSPPEGTLPQSKGPGAGKDTRTPAERAIVPSSIPEPAIRVDSSDEYARKLDNALKRPGQPTPLEALASLEASYNPDYYATVEREAREKLLEFEKSLAAKGIALPQGAAPATSAAPPAAMLPQDDRKVNALHGVNEQPPVLRDPTIFEVKFRSKAKLILTCVVIGVAASAMWIGGYLMPRLERTSSKTPSVATVRSLAPLPELAVSNLVPFPSADMPTERLCNGCTPAAPSASVQSETPRLSPARPTVEREPVKAKTKPSGRVFQKDP
jgi:hypothetical protein